MGRMTSRSTVQFHVIAFVTVLVINNLNACPDHWIGGNSSCYMFFKGKETVDEAVQYCSKYGSYMAVPSDSEELNFLLNIVQGVTYQGINAWRLGIKSTGFSSGIYRTASGEKVSDALDFGTVNGTYVHLKVDGSLEATNNASGTMSFICEQNQAYQGCFLLNNETQTCVISNYMGMSVTQCKETCRADNHLYAMLSPYDCYCAMVLPQQNYDECESTCISGHLQSCGSMKNGSVLSVYKIDMYSLYSDCMELYNAGIRLSGVYVTDTGTTMCNFFDSSTTCDEGWVGYRDNCYIIQTRDDSSLSKIEDNALCERFGGRQGTILDQEMHTFIIGLIKGSESSAVGYIRIGLVDGAETLSPTWVSGILTEYNANDGQPMEYGKIWRMLWSESNYEIFEKVDNEKMADGVLCEKSPDFIGCFSYQGDAIPAALGTGEMELTLCKQTCLVGGYPYVMIRQNRCYCTNGSDFQGLKSLSVFERSCKFSCYSGIHQKCGNHEVVHIYKLERRHIAKSCDQLYKFRILHNATYLINSSGEILKRDCGFSDETSCAKYWLGLDGFCFDFRLQQRIKLSTTLRTCHRRHGYAFTSNNPKNTNFVSSILNVSDAYTTVDYIWIGAYDRFLNGHFLSGDGRVVHLPNWNTSMAPDDDYILKASVPDLHWVEADTEKRSGSIICESSPGYLGCLVSPLVGTLSFALEASDQMTVTTCQQLCIGQNASYAGVNIGYCQCYSELGKNSKRSECKECPGYVSQPCGYGSYSATETVFRIDFYLDEVYESCIHLYRYGITEPSVYRIKPSNFNDFIYVRCFDEDASLRYIQSENLDITTSSVFESYLGQNSVLKVLTRTRSNAWIPNYAPGSYIQFVTQVDYIFSGISTQGLQSPEDRWTTTYSIKYLEESGEWKDFVLRNTTLIPGNEDKLTIVTHFFPDPIITTGMRIYPMSWHNYAALRIGLRGQPFADYNHSTLYIGCYVNIHLYFNETNATSIDDCRVQCKENQQPFFSFYDSSGKFCSCGNNLGNYGMYPDSYCFPEVNSEMFALPLYKTFVLSCSSLSAPAHGKLEDYSVAFGSTVKIVCDSYYKQDDGSEIKVLKCEDTGKWNDTFTDCKDCEDPPSLKCGNVERVNSTHARYSCNNWFTLSTGLPFHFLACFSNFSWDKLDVTCDVDSEEQLISQRQGRFSLLGQYSRLDTSAEIDHNQRCTSFQDCAVACMRSLRCIAYSFNRDYNVCRLYSARATLSNLLSEDRTKYFELTDSNFEVFNC